MPRHEKPGTDGTFPGYAYPLPHYRWYVVAMLWWIAFFNYADRQAIFSVFPLLKTEFALNPVQLGLLGSAFAWIYGLSAPLAGAIVDRVRRKSAILAGLHVWSLICIATAASRSFPALLAFRGAEALGESFYFPASMSLLSDYHGPATRSRALGLHQTSVYIGTIAGGFFAGLIGQHYGWRWSFVVFGALGILLGLVLNKWLIEPKRETPPQASTPAAGFLNPTALLLMAAFLCANFVALVLLSWMPRSSTRNSTSAWPHPDSRPRSSSNWPAWPARPPVDGVRTRCVGKCPAAACWSKPSVSSAARRSSFSAAGRGRSPSSSWPSPPGASSKGSTTPISSLPSST